MPNIEYSIDALNVKHVFYGKKAILYVEGEDDVCFWGSIVSKYQKDELEIEPVGSSTQLDLIIEKIASQEMKAIAARDSDYLDATKLKKKHPRIMYTVGHSIENSLLNQSSIARIIKTWRKDAKENPAECQDWIDRTTTNFRPLLVLEIANHLAKTGVSILGSNCTKYMKNEKSDEACIEKISRKIAEARALIPGHLITAAEKTTPHNANEVWELLRGHFITSATVKFINNRIKKAKKGPISCESLYSQSISIFEDSFEKRHPHTAFYRRTSRVALSSICGEANPRSASNN